MCKAAKVTIAEVEEVVELGEIPPEDVHVPHVYVDRVLLGAKFEKRIEVLFFILCFEFFNLLITKNIFIVIQGFYVVYLRQCYVFIF